MATDICPACGCEIGLGAYQSEGVIYCCEGCATGVHCECGQCVPTGEAPNEQ
jgi:hypothetical protein